LRCGADADSAFQAQALARGALDHNAFVVIEVLEGDKKFRAAVATTTGARDCGASRLLSDKGTISMRIAVRPGHSLKSES